ncbi:MAG TPA: hypothetical protein VFI91_13325 [Longimicrobiaceae bacterium]|nr:hypothetical protein [Longimicrobiaceae bacterium]
MASYFPRISGALRVLLLALIVSACEDSPVGPDAVIRTAAGSEWVAIRVPEQLPDLSDWESTPHGQLPPMPEPTVLLHSFSALDSWGERVSEEVPRGRFPQLDSAVATVEVSTLLAKDALASGDSVGALHQLARAAGAVRTFSPQSVAHNIISRAEQRMAAEQLEGEQADRAGRLFRAARAALDEGDALLALRRGIYALQLAAGAGIPSIDCRPDEADCESP